MKSSEYIRLRDYQLATETLCYDMKGLDGELPGLLRNHSFRLCQAMHALCRQLDFTAESTAGRAITIGSGAQMLSSR